MDIYHFEQTEIGKSLSNARAIAASDFVTAQLQGQRGCDYDSGFMDACRIVRQHPHFDALPDLVDALRALAAVYSGMEDGDGNPCPTIERARALLARLEGL